MSRQEQEYQQAFREEAIPFITYNPDNSQYNVNEDAETFIKNIPQPIGVVAVAGLYRTGKSYLLNRMLLNRSSGFGVGPTVNPCTKGLWVWGSPIKGYSPDGTPLNILIIDSEGIGALDEDQTHDSKVFSLAILLSSAFIYNSVGSIDENAIQNLSLVVNLTKHIQIKSNGNDDCDSEEYSQYFPSFYWVIRDFSLQLCDQDGEAISSKDYLENSLKEQKGISDEVESKNRIRRLLTSFFKDRECITLVRPLLSEDNLQKLDQMEMEQLRPEFFEQVMGFRKSILSHCKPKTMNGKTLNGDMYMSLVRNFITSINDGTVPNIENAWSYVCKDECYKASNNALDVYSRNIKENLYPKLPTTFEELKALHKLAKENAMEVFKGIAIGDIADDFKRKVSDKIKENFLQIQHENEKLSLDNAKNFIEREFSSIDKKLKLLEYKNYYDFNNDVQLFYKFLLEHGPKVVNRHLFYLEFMQKKLHEGATIFIKNLQSDLQIQRDCSKEIMEKNEREIKEIKESYINSNSALENQVQQLEKQRIELLTNEKRNEETIKEQQEYCEKIENELKQDLEKDKQTYTQNIEQLQSRLNHSEEQLQIVQRELLIKESDFNKEKALLEHKAQHYEQQLIEQSQKEQQFDSTMTSAKSQLNTQMKEMQEKFDNVIKAEKQQNQQILEKLNELQELKEKTEKSLENDIELLTEKNNLLTQELQESLATIQQQKSELDSILGDKQKIDQDAQNLVNDQLQTLQSQNSDLSEQLSKLQETLKAEETNNNKQTALLEQKIEFLSAELEETKDKLEEQKSGHQQTLNALEISNMEKQNELANLNENKKLLEMKDNHMKIISQMENDFFQKSKVLNEQIENLTQQCQDLDLQVKVQENDFKDEVQGLKDNLQVTEQQRNDLQQRLKAFEENTQMNNQQSETLQQQKITELEETIEELKEKMLKESNEQQDKSEQLLAEIKFIHENEKERLEQRLQEEKQKRLAGQEGIQEEYEERLREQAESYEDEIEGLKEELMSLETNMSTITNQYEHEIDLKIKNIENMENIIAENKEVINNQQKQFNLKLEQQIAATNQEKLSLNNKIESMTSELQQKEKDLIKIQQKKESIENSLARKEELWETTKADLISEKNSMSSKLEETKKQYQKLQDEFLQHKINYEKSIALSTQQNEFFEKKVEELQKQLELSSSRYEERIKSQKQEWQVELHDKLGKLQEEKQNIESKYDNLKKNVKEGDLNQSKKISSLEKEKAIISEKLTHASQKLADVDEKNKQQLTQINQEYQQVKQQLTQEKQLSTNQIDSLKKQLNTLEQEKHELQSISEKDKVLWEGKFAFLTQQKEQAKGDLQEARKNFEQTLQKLKEARSNDQNQHDNNVQEQLISIENKYQTQIYELNEKNNQTVTNLNQKIKKLEKELQQYQDKSVMDQHSKNNSQIFTEKKMQELFENQKKLQENLEIVKDEKEKLQQELTKKQDKEKETFKQKLNEVEEKFREGERKRNTLMFEHEKERARWNLEKDHLHSQRQDLQDNIQRLEKKKESLLRENERLQNHNRANRRHNPNPGTSFNLNVSRNMSSDKKSPINNRTNILGYGNRYSSNNDHSMINNSFQNEENENNKENSMNILGQLDSAREGQQGFKTFMMKNNQPGSQQQLQSSSQQSQNTEESQQSYQSPALQEKDLN